MIVQAHPNTFSGASAKGDVLPKSAWRNIIFWFFIFTCTLKEYSTDFTHQSLFTDVGEYYCICEKKTKTFWGSKESCGKSDKLPQLMSLESALVGAEVHYKVYYEVLWVLRLREVAAPARTRTFMLHMQYANEDDDDVFTKLFLKFEPNEESVFNYLTCSK